MRDYLAEMLDALTSAYSRKDYDNLQRASPIETLIGKLFSVFSWGLNTVQEQAELIRLWDNIDNARGAVLDRYGANFGVSRFGATDNFYRLAIRVKLLAQLSGGDINTVLDAAASLFEIPVGNVGLEEVFPDKIKLIVNEPDLSEETLDIMVDIIRMVKRILAAGIGLIMCLRIFPETAYAVTGGAFIGSRMQEHAAVSPPPLKKPGGEAAGTAGGLLAGMMQVDTAGIEMPRLPETGNLSLVQTGGSFLWMRRDLRTRIEPPTPAKPLGSAERAAAPCFIGSVEHITVKVRPRLMTPTGSASRGSAASLFHSYQRIWVSVGSPNTFSRG